MPERPCPDLEELQQLLAGTLAGPTAEELETHLLQCEICKTVARKVAVADEFSAALQHGSLDIPDDSVLGGIIERGQNLRELAETRSPQETAGSAQCDPAATFVPSVSKESSAAAVELNFLAPPEQPDEIGRLGNYRILEVLGAGGMGVVFRAEELTLERKVALKAMKPAVAVSEFARQRFLREARATASLENDHIVSIFEVDEDRGIPFIVMPQLQGESLQSRLQTEGSLDQTELLQIGRQVAMGLDCAHQQGLIHRDIKPDNIWIESSGRVKILDFGLVRTASSAGDLTDPGMVMGTPRYMSPEQAQGDEIDHRSDLFSLGSVLYHLAAGQPPFDGPKLTSMLIAVAEQDPVPIHKLRRDLHPLLQSLIMRLLAKPVEQRPQTAAAVRDEITTIESHIHSGRSPGPTELVSPLVPGPPRRFPLLKALLGALLLAAGIITITTRKGVVTIQLDRQTAGDVAVRVVPVEGGDDEIVLTKANNWTVKVRSGEYSLQLVGGEDEFKLRDRKLVVHRFGTNLVEVDYRRADPATSPKPTGKPAPDEQELAVTHPIDHALERRVALWVLNLKGQMHVRVANAPQAATLPVKSEGELPVGPFSILAIVLEDNAKVTDDATESLGQLVNLERLELGKTGIGDTTLARLAGCTSLQHLKINGTSVSSEGLANLVRLPLRTLDVAETSLSTEGLQQIRRMATLEDLCLAGNDLKPLNLALLSAMPALQRLRLHDSSFSDGDIPELAAIPTLRHVHLGKTKVTGKGLRELARTTRLHGLDVTAPSIPFDIIQALNSFNGLKELQLGKTDIAPELHLPPTPYPEAIRFFNRDVPELVDELHRTLKNCAVSWNGVQALPATEIALRLEAQSQLEFEQEVAGLTVEQQINAVRRRLQLLNPFFDGQLQFRSVVKSGRVTVQRLEFSVRHVTDISPLRVLSELKELRCHPSGYHRGRLADLSPLKGLPLRWLNLNGTSVKDLSPLQTLPLTSLELRVAYIKDLSPLKDLKLSVLSIGWTAVSDLTPLKGMPLKHMNFEKTLVADLSPLEGMPLTNLYFVDARVTDLSPLKGMPLDTLGAGFNAITNLKPIEGLPLEYLHINESLVPDLSVVAGMPLEKIWINVRFFQLEDEEILRSLPKLRTINSLPVEEFWKQRLVERQKANEFAKTTAALPVEEQVAAVRARLNGNGSAERVKLGVTVTNGQVVAATLVLEEDVHDLSGIRALTHLQSLTISGGVPQQDLSPLRGMPLTTLNIPPEMIPKNQLVVAEVASPERKQSLPNKKPQP